MAKELYEVTRIIDGKLRSSAVNPRHVAYIDEVENGSPALADAGKHKVVAFLLFAGGYGWTVQGTVEELTRYFNGEERRKF